MEGSSTTGSTIYKAAAAGGEELLSATKRAVQDKAEHAKGESVGAGGLREEWAQGKGDTGSFAGFKDTVSKAADAVEQGVEKVKGWAAQATEAVAGVEKEAATPMSARAEWADTRSESLKAKEKESRKSQLTDEAAGDNPAQAVPREERTTTPDEMYTRH